MTGDGFERFNGRRIWLVTDGTAAEQGWQDAVCDALRAEGAAVEVLGVPGAITATARNLLETGFDAVARAFRITASDGTAQDAAQRMLDRRPELILTDNPGAVRVLVFLRDALRVRSVVTGLVGAFRVAEPWIEARPDALIVPDEQLLATQARPDLPAEGRLVAGPPLPHVFAAPLDRAACRAQVASAPDRRVVVVDATAFHPDRIDAWMSHIGALGVSFDLLLYHGGDALLSDRLRFLAAQTGVVARMFGPGPSLAEIFRAADLVGTGSASVVFESACSLGVPMFSLELHDRELLPGRAGALWVFERPEAAASWIAETLANGPDPRHLEAAAQVAQPMGTAPVVHALADLLMRRGVRTEAAGGPAGGGPMEPIGGGPETVSDDGQPLPTTRDAALQQLAALIREEKQLELRASGVAQERDRWMTRVEMAREEGETELEQVASARLDDLTAQLRQVGERLEALQRRRDAIRRAVAAMSSRARASAADAAGVAPPPSAAGDAWEARFRELEMKRELDRLRRRSESAGETE